MRSAPLPRVRVRLLLEDSPTLLVGFNPETSNIRGERLTPNRNHAEPKRPSNHPQLLMPLYLVKDWTEADGHPLSKGDCCALIHAKLLLSQLIPSISDGRYPTE